MKVSFFVFDHRCSKTSGCIIPFCLFVILCLSVLVLSFRGGAGDGDSIGRFYVDFFLDVVNPFVLNVCDNCFNNFFCDLLALPSALNSHELISLKFIYIRSNFPCPQLLFIFLAFGVFHQIYVKYLFDWTGGKFDMMMLILTKTKKVTVMLIAKKQLFIIFLIYCQSFGLF